MADSRRTYCVGNGDIEQLIERITGLSALPGTERIVQEIFTTVVKLGRESGDMGDLKLVNDALKELRYSFKIFSPFRHIHKVDIFGSARSKPSSPEYKMADEFAGKLTAKGFMVVTGGGSGVMEAGNKGAAPGRHFALTIRLPFEQKTNPYVNEKEKLINFKYFFTRKLIFIKETDATALFPGGFGTHDEGYEALTLIQTGKARPRPVVLMEPPGSTYWRAWQRFVSVHLIRNGFIDREDTELFRVFTDVDAAVRHIEDFYRVYHSIRHVGDLTVLRLSRGISDRTVALLNDRFKDILVKGDIRLSGPLKAESRRGECPGLPRLVMRFNRRDYGRLHKMIRAINSD